MSAESLFTRSLKLPSRPHQTPLAKRIKRHVLGRDRAFFASTIPGFETLLRSEFADVPGSHGHTVIAGGGVEFSGRLKTCYLANLRLRTAHRVIMRLTAFKATNFRQLRRRLQEFPWELFLSPGTEPALSITTKHSRLYHTDAIGGHIEESIKERLSAGAPSSEVRTHAPPRIKVFVRSVDDVFTLSLDSSGEHLHKRGIKTHPAEAPIRETIAAAALMLVGYDGSRPLVDPMCGSGTFSLEAALIYRNFPPGWFRDFDFMTWPAFRPRQWAHIRKDMEQGFRPPPDRPTVWASDTDQTACATLQETIDHVELSDTVSISETDFFDLFPTDIPGKPGIVTINPPYGRRIGTLKESNALFEEICRKLKTDYRGWGLVLIVPRKHLLNKVPFRLHCHALHHGGLKLGLLTGTID